jgi:polyphosphate kinase
LHERVIEWIENETRNALEGKTAGIRAKMNGLVEKSVVEALYRASQAGVPIDLIVRGMDCARPHVPGLSERVRVRSIVDKYLEHSRVFIFENGGDRKVWLSSADWMPRNFFRRIELAFPILNPAMIEWISNVFWGVYDRDTLRARECMPDGRYERILGWGRPDFRAQFAFEELKIPAFPPSAGAQAKPSQVPSHASPSKE